MASSAPVATGPVDPADRLRRAHAMVIARVAGPATGGPEPVRSATPIRTLPSSAAAVVAARNKAGLSPVGEHFPRRATLRRIGVPSAALAGLAVAVALVAVVTERDVLALTALGVFVVLAAVGGATLGWALDDPLRINPSQRRSIDAASRWTPGRSLVATGPARALVAVAATAAQRVVDSPGWRSGVLARGGVAVPLGTELDLTEQRAAVARDEDWARLVTRVAALVAYADAVTILEVNDGELDAADAEVLAFLLSAAIYRVG